MEVYEGVSTTITVFQSLYLKCYNNAEHFFYCLYTENCYSTVTTTNKEMIRAVGVFSFQCVFWHMYMLEDESFG